jgi:Fic family protein
MLRAVESTARLTYQKVNDILNAKQTVLEAVESETSFQRPDQLVDVIFTQPFTKVNHLTDDGIYAENTSRSYLNELAEMNVLEKKQIKGRHYYRNHELEEILSY